MSDKPSVKLVLCWHMHQPHYCDLINGEYQLPWSYLHGIKDYTDMAAHLEAFPKAKAVVNFAPILLEQLSDYSAQVQGFLREGKAIRDPLLAALACPTLPSGTEKRLDLVKACQRANKDRMVKRFKPFQKLVEMADWFLDHPAGMAYVDDQFIVDMLVWYHLAWMGETVRRVNPVVKRLEEKGMAFNVQDRRELVEVIGELLSGVLRRYRALAEEGRVELSVTPYAHPIMPLLIDLGCAREAMPDVKLPTVDRYPDGENRVAWHLQEAINIFQEYFGFRPQGCWPSEGSLSEPTLRMLTEAGFKWTASGESVLRNSLAKNNNGDENGEEDFIYQAYNFGSNGLPCFFRDDGLSDLIGFTYSEWHADDAVANLIHHLENIGKNAPPDKEAIVSIILDGENAWEYYPENGFYFLRALYRGLSDHPGIAMTTFSDYLNGAPEGERLERLISGSWVYGTFSTWIGDQDKNKGWELLVDAKRTFDKVTKETQIEPDRQLAAQHQLSICEGSDWFWWFGDYNPADTVSDFDHLYRVHLMNLYHLLGMAPPEALTHKFSHGSGTPEKGGVMRHGGKSSGTEHG